MSASSKETQSVLQNQTEEGKLEKACEREQKNIITVQKKEFSEHSQSN